jgi:hypothetical protein
MQKLQRLLAYFLLIVFLFPLAQIEVHAFAHQNDFHCDSKDFHLHEAEHHCSLCDYVPTSSDKPDSFIFEVVQSYFTEHKFSQYQSVAIECYQFNFCLRGPPTVS